MKKQSIMKIMSKVGSGLSKGGKCVYKVSAKGSKATGKRFMKLGFKSKVIVLVIVGTLGGGIYYAATEDVRELERLETARIQEVIDYNQDKAEADAKKAEMDAKIKRAELVMNEISRKGELVTASTELKTNVSVTKNHDGWWSKTFTGNAVNLEIAYTADYKIPLDRVKMTNIEGEIYVDIDARDFELVLVQGEIISRDVSSKDKGWFASDFDDKETIAILQSDKEQVGKQLKADINFITEAEQGLNDALVDLAKSWGVDIKFTKPVVTKGGK